MQWPHQGAKTGRDLSALGELVYSESIHGRLTLGEDEVIGLDEAIKAVLGELLDVRGSVSSGGDGGKGREEAVGYTLLIHDEV